MWPGRPPAGSTTCAPYRLLTAGIRIPKRSLPKPLREHPELLPDATVEAPARQLGETADRLREANLELITRRQLPRRLAVERDLDRLATGGVSHHQGIVGRDDECPGGEGVRRDEADHIPLHAPGEDRPRVGEVVASRARGGGGHQPVAPDAPHLLLAERV